MRRTAKIIIVAVQLVCPNCRAVVTASNGEMTLRRDTADERWELLARKSYECSRCYTQFRLPANPFKS